jgi:dTMP kinase
VFRLIAFEGVDGAGKSTVLQRVAALLRERGETVGCPREGKQPYSRIARRIRELTRAVEHPELDPVAELALYCAREAQVLGESVRPALARGERVLLDRSLLTPLVIALARALPREQAEAMIVAADGGGPRPDLTLVFDVELRTARQRKRIAKVVELGFRQGGRKSLAGSGFKRRVQDGYRGLVRELESPLVRVPAERSSPDELARFVLAWIDGATPEPDDRDERPWWRCDPSLALDDPHVLIEALTAIPERLAIWLSRNLPVASELRARAWEREPELVGWCLGPDEGPLRARVLERAPRHVLAGMRGEPLAQDDLRLQWIEHEPVWVARSLTGVAGPEADALRRRLVELLDTLEGKARRRLSGALVESVASRQDAFAQQLRERGWSDADVHERAIGLRGCTDAWAQEKRAELFERDPARALTSLRGLPPELADGWIARWADHAPKPALAALAGRTDRAAHALREHLAASGDEVIDSLRQAGDAFSWTLRERAIPDWPIAVAESLRWVATDHPERARLLAILRERARGDLELHCRLAQLDQVFTTRRISSSSSV